MAVAQHGHRTGNWQHHRIGPLGAVVLLHLGLFFALRSGLPQAAAPAEPKELFATFITPEPPAAATPPAAQLAPPRPHKTATPAPPKARPVPAAAPAPSQHAISTPVSAEPPAESAQHASPAAAPAAPAAAATQPAAAAQPKTISSGAEYLQPPQPRYPPLSRRMGEEGRAVLRVLVTAQGIPERAEIRTSSGSARLDEAAREAVLRAQFKPHIDNGQAVAVFVIVPIRFQLNN